MIFGKNFFAADFSQKWPEKEVFGGFLKIGSLFFSDFLHKYGHLDTYDMIFLKIRQRFSFPGIIAVIHSPIN